MSIIEGLYSGTPLNGHPSIMDTSIIIMDKFQDPDCFPLTSIQPFHNGHPTIIMDKICGSKLSALEGFHCIDVNGKQSEP